MKLRPSSLSIGVLAISLASAACAVSSDAEAEAAEASAELNALTPDEILGEIRFGQTVDIAYTPAPRYRAYWFQGTKGDWLDVVVTSSNGPVAAFVTDDQFRSVRRGTKAVLPKTGKYFIAVRDEEMLPGTLTVKFVRHVSASGELPPAND